MLQALQFLGETWGRVADIDRLCAGGIRGVACPSVVILLRFHPGGNIFRCELLDVLQNIKFHFCFLFPQLQSAEALS